MTVWNGVTLRQNKMTVTNHVLTSTHIGLVVTLVTHKLSKMPPTLVRTTKYGCPFARLIRLRTAPGCFPCRTDSLDLLIDIAVWSAVIALLLTTIQKAKKCVMQQHLIMTLGFFPGYQPITEGPA